MDGRYSKTDLRTRDGVLLKSLFGNHVNGYCPIAADAAPILAPNRHQVICLHRMTPWLCAKGSSEEKFDRDVFETLEYLDRCGEEMNVFGSTPSCIGPGAISITSHSRLRLGRLTAAGFAFGVPILLKRGLLRPGDSRSGQLMPRRFRPYGVLPPAPQRSRET